MTESVRSDSVEPSAAGSLVEGVADPDRPELMAVFDEEEVGWCAGPGMRERSLLAPLSGPGVEDVDCRSYTLVISPGPRLLRGIERRDSRTPDIER